MSLSNYQKMLHAFLFQTIAINESHYQRFKRIIIYYILFKLLPIDSLLLANWHNGLRIAVSKADPGLKNNLYFGYAEKELAILDFIPTIVTNLRDVDELYFFDCGANSGQYTLKAASSGIFKEVIAFEPSQTAYKRLETNIKFNSLNEKVSLKAEALGESEYNALFSVLLDQENHILQNSSPFRQSSQTVRVRTLDSLPINPNVQVIIKLDVEGYEANVLKGAENLLKQQVLLIIMEVNSSSLKNYDVDPFLASSMLVSHGFEPFHLSINNSHYSLNKMTLEHLRLYSTDDNYIFLNRKMINSLKQFSSLQVNSPKNFKNTLEINGITN